MKLEDVSGEIERLKELKVELANKINLTRDSDDKEEIRLEISRIQKQIDTLERFKQK